MRRRAVPRRRHFLAVRVGPDVGQSTTADASSPSGASCPVSSTTFARMPGSRSVHEPGSYRTMRPRRKQKLDRRRDDPPSKLRPLRSGRSSLQDASEAQRSLRILEACKVLVRARVPALHRDGLAASIPCRSSSALKLSISIEQRGPPAHPGKSNSSTSACCPFTSSICVSFTIFNASPVFSAKPLAVMTPRATCR